MGKSERNMGNILGKLWETMGKILGKHGEILENKVPKPLDEMDYPVFGPHWD
jgi:hypothetical protein